MNFSFFEGEGGWVKTTFIDSTARVWCPVVKEVVLVIPLECIMQFIEGF